MGTLWFCVFDPEDVTWLMMPLKRWSFWSHQLFPQSWIRWSDENNSSAGTLQRGGYKKLQGKELSGNLAGVTNNVRQQLSLLRVDEEDVLMQWVAARALLPNSELAHARRSGSLHGTRNQSSCVCPRLWWCPRCRDTVCFLLVMIMCYYLWVPAETAWRCGLV